jgi:hypothetical protein
VDGKNVKMVPSITQPVAGLHKGEFVENILGQILEIESVIGTLKLHQLMSRSDSQREIGSGISHKHPQIKEWTVRTYPKPQFTEVMGWCNYAAS